MPEELAVLNRMEARLIGLGVSFTTCVNLYADGQEFTRGNSVNYWNNVVDTVLELPRRIRKCGIVYLKTGNSDARPFFKVRPDIVRRALCWLIDNNPLYRNVHISEENLVALREFDVEIDLPSISLTAEEARELCIQHNEINTQPHLESLSNSQNLYDPNENEATQTTSTAGAASQCERGCQVSSGANDAWRPYSNTNTESELLTSVPEIRPPDPLSDLIDSFELERDVSDKQTELECIVQAANLACQNPEYPVKELQQYTEPIDEYKTKLLMQTCFPTLFPNGQGGYNPIDGKIRANEFHLAEFCAHLMKWHDRRYVIHGSFNFFA
ncbi:unnamed protein product [Phytophthora fragariaefolia]|uniref:Unnamed protein product n=1 Tax=Phytophthora fragariaefolia TaxID=1490495 RepID=A0A9W6XCD1_9STRA|nr:unnamed protein product [Phytophthora fragariaefolia]